MKRTMSIICALCLVAMAAGARVSAQEVKLGYIDTVKIFAEFKETVEAEEIYKKEVEAWKRQASEMETEIARLREEIQSQSLMLSEEALGEKKLALEQKFNEYQQFMNNIFGEEGEAARRNTELTQPIVEKINAVIADIAQEEGYTMIFDAAQGNIVYAVKTIDLTQQVLEKLSEQLESAQ